jgi:hypothetical protein
MNERTNEVTESDISLETRSRSSGEASSADFKMKLSSKPKYELRGCSV